MRDHRDVLREFISIAVRGELNENLDVRDAGPHQWVLGMTRGMSDGGNESNGYGFRVGKWKDTYEGLVTFAPILVEKDWGKGYDRIPPFRPKDVLPALKHGSVRVGEEVIQIDGAAKEALIARWAPIAARWVTEKVDIVTAPQSSSDLAHLWGQALAHALGAKFVSAGVLKDMASAEIAGDLPDNMTPKTRKDLDRNLARMKAAENPKIHDFFHTSHRKFVTKWMKTSDQLVGDALGVGKDKVTVLLADDIVTTGSTGAESVKALQRVDPNFFHVVGALTLFKMKDSR